jgi:hypothetical protein
MFFDGHETFSFSCKLYLFNSYLFHHTCAHALLVGASTSSKRWQHFLFLQVVEFFLLVVTKLSHTIIYQLLYLLGKSFSLGGLHNHKTLTFFSYSSLCFYFLQSCFISLFFKLFLCCKMFLILHNYSY